MAGSRFAAGLSENDACERKKKMSVQDNVVFILEVIGTVAFAVSGALVGIQKSMDIFGVCVLGVITAVGGGAVRDIVVGIIPPNVFRNPVYATVAVLVSCLVFGVMYFRQSLSSKRLGKLYDGAMMLMDAVGLGIFTVVGVNAGLQQGYGDNAFLLIFTGTVTGVGGGLLRDVMAGVPPYIFVRHIYACASIAGAVACTALYSVTGMTAAMFAGVMLVLVIRCLASRYRWNLPRISLENE